MPVRVEDHLPAINILSQENIFVMTQERASTQDIRPLRLLVLNLMPTKEVTETQLLRVIGNTPVQADVVFLRTSTHKATHTSQAHMDAFYVTFDEVAKQKFDGLIITGAPVEQMEFEEVRYWTELTRIMDWAQSHVTSTFYICWAAQAGLYYRYGVKKYPLDSKCSGIYNHAVLAPTEPLVRGFDTYFNAPHSRHTEVRAEEIERIPDLTLLAVSDEVGVYLAASKDRKHVFVTGHGEYDADTLKQEYERDVAKGIDVPVPANYFTDDDPTKEPMVTWRAHANLLFANWLNYHVYQETPYDIEQIGSNA